MSDQRVVAITGASSGIGRATAHELSRRGGALILISRDAAALAAVVEECEALGGRAFAAPADVNDEDALRDAACRAIDALGRLDAWINCAAVVAYGRFEETPSAVFRRVIETNVLGYANGARIALNEFRRRGRAVRALRPTYPPENVAKTIASLLDHPRAEVVIGGSARAAIAQARFARPVYERFGARYLDAAQFENAPSSSTEGNLFRTMGRKAVSGGWGTSSLRWRRIAAAAMGGLFAFFALRKLRR